MGLAAAGTVDDRRAHRAHAAARAPRLRRDAAWPAATACSATARCARRAPRESMGTRWARFVTRARCRSLLVGLAVPRRHRAARAAHEARPARRRLQADLATERRAYDLLAEGFGPGFNGPLTVVVDAPNLSRRTQKGLANELVDGLEKVRRRRRRHARRRRTRPATSTHRRWSPRRPSPRPTRPRTWSTASARQGRRRPRADRHPAYVTGTTAAEHRHRRHAQPPRCRATSRSSSGWP